MKVMYLKVSDNETRKYEIKYTGGGWFELSCDGAFITSCLGEEDCRRIIWAYWNNFGVNLEYFTDDDFVEVEDE